MKMTVFDTGSEKVRRNGIERCSASYSEAEKNELAMSQRETIASPNEKLNSDKKTFGSFTVTF